VRDDARHALPRGPALGHDPFLARDGELLPHGVEGLDEAADLAASVDNTPGKIPITTKARYEDAMRWGGVLMTTNPCLPAPRCHDNSSVSERTGYEAPPVNVWIAFI
jgi:hypothetical protein